MNFRYSTETQEELERVQLDRKRRDAQLLRRRWQQRSAATDTVS